MELLLFFNLLEIVNDPEPTDIDIKYYRRNRPLIDDNSAYYRLKNEIFYLNPETVEIVFLFYSHIMSAEEERSVLCNHGRDYPFPPAYEFKEYNKAIKSAFNILGKLEDKFKNISDRSLLYLFFTHYL